MVNRDEELIKEILYLKVLLSSLEEKKFQLLREIAKARGKMAKLQKELRKRNKEGVVITYCQDPKQRKTVDYQKCHCGANLYKCGDVKDGCHCLSCGYYRHGLDSGHGEGYPKSCSFKTTNTDASPDEGKR